MVKVCHYQTQAGDVYVAWAELGKIPYTYWEDQESNDINRLCELCKPWLILRPQLRIALEDFDMLGYKDTVGFNKWWADYHDVWCQHWNISNWTVENMFACIVIGHTNANQITQLLKNKIHPQMVRL